MFKKGFFDNFFNGKDGLSKRELSFYSPEQAKQYRQGETLGILLMFAMILIITFSFGYILIP